MNANALTIQRHQQTKEGKPVFNKTIRSSLILCGSVYYNYSCSEMTTKLLCGRLVFLFVCFNDTAENKEVSEYT